MKQGRPEPAEHRSKIAKDPTPSGFDRLPRVAALEYFTDREEAIHAFRRYVHAAEADALRVLVFYGVGGIGKTALVQRLAADLREADPPVPNVSFGMENIGDQTRAYREVLLRWRCDLEREFQVAFPHFDLCLAVMLAREGGDPPPLVKGNRWLKLGFDFATTLLEPPVPVLGKLFGEFVRASGHGVAQVSEEIIERIIEQHPHLEKIAHKLGRTEDVVRLRERALRDDQTLPEELVRRFAQDLTEHLPARQGKGCRGVLFLDTYELLWSGREAGGSAQARLLDEWVRSLAGYGLGSGVLLVISSRDRLTWADADPDWQASLDQHLLGGLSARDAQTFLARCGIGAAPVTPASSLQRAIIGCCNASRSPSEVSAHPLYLALCAEIVLNSRRAKRIDPKLEEFTAIPTQQVARELATRFLRSLHNSALELWIQELSLTPRFDDHAAFALDAGRHHQNGRSGWHQLTRFSFVDPQPEGFYRLHKTMQEVLQARVGDADTRAVHQWFVEYWTQRAEAALIWYHRWSLDPGGTLQEWEDRHKEALKTLQIAEARQLLTWWAEIALDDGDRRRMGDELWAKTHHTLARALWATPVAPRAAALTAAIGHCQAALQVFTETAFPPEWAKTQNNLGMVYRNLPTGDRGENLGRAIECYEAALRVWTETAVPYEWARTQNNLGVAYQNLPTGDRGENLGRAIECYEAALRVRTETAVPHEWAMTQNNLGVAYQNLPTGDRGENLGRAIECYEAALRVWTETAVPYEWARTQDNLGAAYAELHTGDRDENLHRAIACHEAALRVLTESTFPYQWAVTQTNLGNVYRNLPTGDRGENLRRAIAYNEAALRVWTETAFPADWAGAQTNLGVAYANLPTGDRAADLQQAIACYEAALRVQTETAFPQEWARTQYDLGEAYRERPGDRAESIRTAIEHYQAALRVRTETGFPRDWAETQRALGIAYQELAAVTGDTRFSIAAETHLAAARHIPHTPA